jgi:hypothetical protein
VEINYAFPKGSDALDPLVVAYAIANDVNNEPLP